MRPGNKKRQGQRREEDESPHFGENHIEFWHWLRSRYICGFRFGFRYRYRDSLARSGRCIGYSFSQRVGGIGMSWMGLGWLFRFVFWLRQVNKRFRFWKIAPIFWLNGWPNGSRRHHRKNRFLLLLFVITPTTDGLRWPADKQNGQKRQPHPQTFCWTINNSYTFFAAPFPACFTTRSTQLKCKCFHMQSPTATKFSKKQEEKLKRSVFVWTMTWGEKTEAS